RDFLPAVNGRRVELLDHPKMVAQLCALERRVWRGGRDSIDHPPNQHDDIINCVAGALTNLIGAVEAPQPVFGTWTTGPCANQFGYNGPGPQSAGEIFASMPPAEWAKVGVYHPSDKAYWESKG